MFEIMFALRRLGAACCVALAAVQAGEASALSSRPGKALPKHSAVYASVDECIISRLIDEDRCRTGFANARAEFEEKAPRFSSRPACEASFPQCSVFLPAQPRAAGAMSKPLPGVEFVPLMDRVEFLSGKDGAKLALPSARANRQPVRFSPRATDKPDAGISARRGEGARQGWQAALARASRPAASAYAGGTVPPGAVSFADPEAANALDQPASFPVSSKRWGQMQADIERIKRAQQGKSGKPGATRLD